MSLKLFINSNLMFMLIYIINLSGAAKISHIQDIPYEPIAIKVPLKIWQQAFHPTPVLKSRATIVLPIHVAADDDFEDSDDIIDENEATQTDENVDEQTGTDQLRPTTITPLVTADVVTSTTASTVLDDSQVSDTNSSDVAGQVLRFPCACIDGQCGCCTGMLLQRINMKACGNISFVPEDFIFDVRMTMNNRTVVRRRVSASDPPPICFNPRRAPFVEVCAELSNIRIRNRNAFACLDINANIGGFDIYSASFRCFGLGSSGVQTGLKPKPVSSGPTPVNLFPTRDEDNDNGDGIFGDVANDLIGGGGGSDDGGGIFGGAGNGLFGGGGSSDNDNDNSGPFDGISDVFDGFGDFLDSKR